MPCSVDIFPPSKIVVLLYINETEKKSVRSVPVRRVDNDKRD
jgi:hypothetical protein